MSSSRSSSFGAGDGLCIDDGPFGCPLLPDSLFKITLFSSDDFCAAALEGRKLFSAAGIVRWRS